jgi:hypothetical protein
MPTEEMENPIERLCMEKISRDKAHEIGLLYQCASE